jgi:hypothetical protein
MRMPNANLLIHAHRLPTPILPVFFLPPRKLGHVLVEAEPVRREQHRVGRDLCHANRPEFGGEDGLLHARERAVRGWRSSGEADEIVERAGHCCEGGYSVREERRVEGDDGMKKSEVEVSTSGREESGQEY